MVNKTLIVALGLLALVNRSVSSSCLTCYFTDCGPQPTCIFGVTKDPCGCCDVCAKGLGEPCGGPWGSSGTCSKRLECQLDSNNNGTCVNKIPIDPCAPSPEEVCDERSYCGSDFVKYNNSCAFKEAKCRNPSLKRTRCFFVNQITNTIGVNRIQKLGADQELHKNNTIKAVARASGPKSKISKTKQVCPFSRAGKDCNEIPPFCGNDGRYYTNRCVFKEAKCSKPTLRRTFKAYCDLAGPETHRRRRRNHPGRSAAKSDT